MSKKQILDWDKSAEHYSKSESSFKKNVFEYYINYPSILNLINIKIGARILDVGCGDGEFTSELAKKFKNIVGSDASDKMIQIAKNKHPEINFFIWDIEKKYLGVDRYDAITAKLVLMFVENISSVARQFYRVLNKKGITVISVIHPFYWTNQFILNRHKIINERTFSGMTNGYFSNTLVVKKINNNDKLRFGFTHRTIQDYVNTFTNAGFLLDRIDEPRIDDTFLDEHKEFAGKKYIPMRLNMRFIKPF